VSEIDWERQYNIAVDFLKDRHSVGTPDLQRHLQMGYTGSARIMDMLEQRSIVGPYIKGGYPRKVLAIHD